MTWLAPNTFLTFCRGMDRPALSAAFADAGLRATASGESAGWAWLSHDTLTVPSGEAVRQLARDITGHRYEGDAETVFLASTPPCACPHGQNFMVPHCPEHPFQVTWSRGGFEQLYLNVGGRRESRRGGGSADLLVRELLDAGIVGRDTSRYDADPGFNADGALTIGLLVRHFRLPSPPLAG
ncbi:hypothetical protein [Streptomyces sp. NPDC058867]|uniref:hypothetical protein n=1 Tax=unclassified Streptomyces TaxID=2593676 RepID=UPI0036AE0EF9